MECIKEAGKDIEIIKKADVVVVGAGVSGITAALASARAGASTVLIERSGRLGGVAVSTLMTGFGNMFVDKYNFPLAQGIPREIVENCIKKGGLSSKWEDHSVSNIGFDPEILELVFIEKLEEAGVNVFLNTIAADVIMQNETVKGVIIQSKWARQAVVCHTVADCSGEADMLVKAGAPIKSFKIGDKSVNHGTLLFRMANINIDKFVDYIVDNDEYPENIGGWTSAEEFRNNWYERGIIYFPHGGGKKMKIFREAISNNEYSSEKGIAYSLDAFGVHGIRGNPVAINSNYFWVYDEALDAESMSAIQMEARRICHYTSQFLKNNMPGFENGVLAQTANDLGIRISRWVNSGRPFTKKDWEDGSKFDDVIGVTPAVCHGKHGYMFTGAHTDIPFRIMLPQKVEGIITGSGKSIDTEPAGIIRGMSRCMLIGQACGAAAALSAKEETNVKDIDIRKVQKELISQGAFLGSEERLIGLGLLKK